MDQINSELIRRDLAGGAIVTRRSLAIWSDAVLAVASRRRARERAEIEARAKD